MSTQQLTRVEPKGFMEMLEKSKGQIAAALPKHLTVERMMRLAMTTFRNNPKLAECDPVSVIASVIQSAQCGLEIGVLGRAFLVPYGRTCTFIPGWLGLVDLMNRTGKATVWTGAVYQGDVFEFQQGSEPRVYHVPMGEDDPDKMTHVYACGKVNGAERPVIECWPIAKVWKHRDRFNKVGNRHYSFVHPEAYARKIVLLRVLDYMPASVEVQQAIMAEHAATAGARVNIDDLMGGSWVPSEVIDVEPNDVSKEPAQDKPKTSADKLKQAAGIWPEPPKGDNPHAKPGGGEYSRD
jgi:recombination protein RecT